MKRIVFIFAISLAIFSSCSPLKHLYIENIGVSEFRMESSTKADITFNVSVQSDVQYPISLSFMEASIKKDMDLFATIDLVSEVTVPQLADGVVKVPVEITLCDPMSLLSMGLNVKKWDINEFVVSGKVVLKGKNGAKTTYKIKEKPMSTLLNHIVK